MESVIIERPGANGPYGAKGIGEMTANAPIPAIANAIFDAVRRAADADAVHARARAARLDELRRDDATLGSGSRAERTSPTRGCSPRSTSR
jgi:CO/xanthine dehydrogenase Mo-binding subunit